MKFSTRLYVAFSLSATLTFVLGLFALYQTQTLAAHTHAVTKHWMPSAELLGAIKSEMREFRTQELQHILSNEASEMDDWEGRMSKAKLVIDKKVDAYERLSSSDAERRLLGEFKQQFTARMDAHERVRKLSRGMKKEEAIAFARGEVAQLRTAAAATIDKLLEFNEHGAATEEKAADRTSGVATVLVPAAIAVALVASALLAFLIVRSTMRQLGGDPADAKAAVERIGAGDLITPISLRNGDTDSLMWSLATMSQRLAHVVSTIVAGSSEIRTASQEVARGNLDLSTRTEQQSSSLQETASALEQITGTITSTSDNAKAANGLAQTASSIVDEGDRAVAQVVQTMQAIAESSRRVQEITGVIDGIAFQTNILALNAAVEAARAGEQGRGFAVVASEVRTLAQRSSEAAKEIKRLLEDSAKKVDDGAKQAAQAGATMSGVMNSVRQVTSIIAEISTSTDQQSVGVSEINDAIGQLDSVTQQNAALVEEAAAATKSMEEQANSLFAAVSVFRISASAHGEAHESSRSAGTQLSPRSFPALPATTTPLRSSASINKTESNARADSWQSF